MSHRYLTKIELLDAKPNEPRLIIKALAAKDGEKLRTVIIPNLPELQGREYKYLDSREMEEVDMCTSTHKMLGFNG